MFTNIRRYPLCCSLINYKLPQQNLSLSPSEIASLTERGFSASAGNLGLTFDLGSPSPVLMPENARGVDPADLWQASRASVDKLVSAHKIDKEINK
ncbi:hypothetical protein [Microviridae sp.]|nr:hypothetical protein [Microviridae sp.]